jgi:dethiobiotin synthetase
MNASRLIFICGTDTDVGKTMTLGAIAAYLTAKKKDFCLFKPFESGPTQSDSLFLSRMTGNRLKVENINFHHFTEALAPGIAAKRTSKKINYAAVVKRIKTATQKHTLIFIEGAGGLLVPLAGKKTNLDLIKDLQAEVLLVGRLELGTLNHTHLTYDRLIQERIPVTGILLKQTQPKLSLAAKTNPRELHALGLPLLGVIPYLKSTTAAALVQALPVRVKKMF